VKKFQKPFLVVSFIFLAAFQFFKGVLPGWQMRSDFPNYYLSSKLVVEHRTDSIYNDHWFSKELEANGFGSLGKFSPFPPPTAFIMLPFIALEPLTAKRVWMVINIVFLFLTGFVIMKITGWKYLGCMNLLLLTGIGLANDLYLGQFYLSLLLIMLLAYHLSRSSPLFAGMLAGFGMAIKYFPAIMLPANLKNRRFIAGAIFSFVLLYAAAFMVFGKTVFGEFISSVLLPHLDGHIGMQSPWSPKFQSWNALFSNLFLFDAVQNPHPVLNSLAVFNIFKLAVTIFFIVVSFLTYLVARKSYLQNELFLVLISITVMELFPASATYHFVLLVFPAVLLMKNYQATYVIILVCILMTAIGFGSPLIDQFANGNLFLAFHRLWLMTLFYFGVIFILLRQSRNPQRR